MVLLRRVQRSSLTLQSRNYSVERNVCPCIPCQPFVLSVSYACTVCKDQGVRLVTSIDLQVVTDFFSEDIGTSTEHEQHTYGTNHA
jgi:hypothetical protein